MSTSTNLPRLYERKENVQENLDIPRINKVTDDDMNIIKDLLENSIYKDNEGMKDYSENIFDPKIPRYEETKYNLITDGPAVKTGRKVDGKDEYVKRISTSISNGTNKRVDLGLPLNAIIRDYTGMISEGISSGAKVRDGFFLSTTNFFSMHVAGIQMQIITGTTSDWITSAMRCYIDVFFTFNSEEDENEYNSSTS